MGMYGGLSFGHVLVAVVILAVFLFPIARILRRAGRSPAWCLLLFVPLGNIVGLWAFAYARWPAVDDKTPDAPQFH